MNLSNLFLFCSLALLSTQTQAQTPNEPEGQHITYQSALPESVSRLMPQGAKSLFWGTFTPEGTKFPMSVHLMRLKPQSEVLVGSSKKSFRYYSLDLFKKREGRWQHLVNASLFYPTRFGDKDNFTYSALFYWVDTKEKKIPLLRFHVFERDGGYGPIGEALFVSFARGWTLPPAVQSFRFGEWFSSDSIGQANTVRWDDKGMAKIEVKIFPASDSGPGELCFLWDRKRGRFWPDAQSQEIIAAPDSRMEDYLNFQ